MEDEQRNPRNHHESQCDDVLCLLMTHPMRRCDYERQLPGSRLAPAIDVLRNKRGYLISGDGSFEYPYTLDEVNPTKVELTDELYAAYLKSEYWLGFREKRLKFDGYRCIQCGSTNCLQVHHWKYSLFDERLFDCCSYCEGCHDMVHARGAKGRPGCITRETALRILRGVAEPLLQ